MEININKFNRYIVILLLFIILIFLNISLFATNYLSSAVTQNTSATTAGSVDQQILRLSVTGSGGGTAASVCYIQFTMQNTNNADVNSAKLYYTGTSSTFATTTLLGTIADPTGTIQFNISHQVITGTTYYYWLAYDIDASSANCNAFDAFVPANGIQYKNAGTCGIPTGTATPTTPDPSGARIIETVGCWTYCTSTHTVGTTYYFSNVTFESINNTTTNACGSMYCDYTAQSATVVPGSSYNITVTAKNGANPAEIYVYFDWNNDGVFTNGSPERYYIGQSPATGPTVMGPVSIAVPSDATAGATTMRVVLTRSDDAIDPCNPHASGYGETEDYTINVCNPPSVTGQPSSPAAVCLGTGTPSFTVTATGDGLTYQWQEYISSWINVSDGGYYSGATTASLTITNPIFGMNGYKYRCVVTGTCGTATSNGVATLTVNPATSVTTQPASTIACAGASTPSFTVSVSGVSLTYQWQEFISGWLNVSDGGVYSGATSATLTITNPPLGMNSYKYRCTATGTCGAATSDGVATLTVVDPVLSITDHPDDVTVCQNVNTSFTVAALGSIFQWQVNTGAGWNNITAAGSSPAYSNWTTSTLNLTGTDNPSGYQYRCLAGCNQLASNAATLTVIPPSDPTPTGASRCGTGTLILSATGAISGEVYKWYDAITGGTLLKTSTDETDNTYTTPSISVTTNYYVTIFRTAGGCESAPRTLIVATINTPVSISAHPADQVICTGDNAVFNVTATGTGLTYQWRKNGVNISDGGQVSGATTASLSISSVAPANDGNYDCVCTGTCNTVTSNTALLDADPTAALAGVDQIISTTSTTLQGNLPTTGTGTWTRISGPNTPNIVNVNLYNTQIGTTTALITGTYVYRWTIVLGGCTSFDEVTITKACIGTYTNDCAGSADIYIANVNVSDIDNSSSCSGGATQNYTNFTNVIGSVEANSSYPITLTHGGSVNSTWFGIWVDWNKDGLFTTDATEFMAPINCPGGVSSNSGTLDVPAGTPEGTYFMRIRAKFSTTMAQSTVCDNYAYGETEDYTLRVVPATCSNLVQDGTETSVDCGGLCFTPVAGTITGGGSYSCGSTIILTSINAQGSRQWQYSRTGGDPWFDIGGETSSTYSGSVSSSMYFRVEVTGGSCSAVYTPSATVTITGTATNTWLTTGTTSWTTGSNWSLGHAPIACENVLIPAGGSQPTVAPAGNIECNDITVDFGATLTLNYNTAKTFQVWGNILNNGTINSTNTGKWTLRGVLTTWGGTGTYTGTMYLYIGDDANVFLTDDVNVYVVEMTATEPYGSLSLGDNTLTITNTLSQAASTIYMNTGTLNLETTAGFTLSLESLYPEYGTIIYANPVAGTFVSTGYWAQVGGTGFYNVIYSPAVGVNRYISCDLLIRGDLTIQGAGNVYFDFYTGAVPANPYTVQVQGNIINNSSNLTITSDFTFIMNGSNAQSIGGTQPITFYNLTINNTSSTGVTLNQNENVANVMNLTDGELILNEKTLTITNAATSAITGGSASSYIVSEHLAATNNSIVKWTGTTTGAHVFPFGYSGSYLPLTFNNSSSAGAFITASTRRTAASDNAPVATGVDNPLYSAIEPTNSGQMVVIDRWWEISPTTVPTSTNVTFTYRGVENTLDATYQTGNIGVQHWTGDTWNDGKGGPSMSITTTGTPGVTGAGTSSVTATGLTEFSPYLLVAEASPLPIKLISFEAICNDNTVDFVWSTASEMNNDYFTIERSNDGINFIPLKTVKGAGNSNSLINYSSTDDKPLKDLTYYRLKQTDFDGRFNYSKVIVTCNGILDNTKININLYPNPAQEGQSVYLDIDGLKEKEILVVVYNTFGQQLFSKIVISNTNGVMIEAIDSHSHLKPGVYYVVASSNSNLFNRKLVIR